MLNRACFGINCVPGWWKMRETLLHAECASIRSHRRSPERGATPSAFGFSSLPRTYFVISVQRERDCIQ